MDTLLLLSRRLNSVLYALDRAYFEHEKRAGVRNAELCLMYALDDGQPHSQKEISEDWEIPRTTLNTIAKIWERKGYIRLQPIAGKRRDMQIVLTREGIAYIRPQLQLVYRAEKTAMGRVLAKYDAGFIDALESFQRELNREFEQIAKENQTKEGRVQ